MRKKINQKQKYFKNLKKVEDELNQLKSLEPLVRERGRFNSGLFYGLFFGILGNFYVALIFELIIKDLSMFWQWISFIITSLILLFFMFIIKREWNVVGKYYKKLEMFEKSFNSFPKLKHH